MVTAREDAASTIAQLEARVARLEELLADRSRILRLLARGACDEDLEAQSRLAAALPLLTRSAVGLPRWRETTELTSDDVETTMKTLWRSIAPFYRVGEE